MTKFRLYYDKDDETKWLNELVSQGFAMTGFFAGFYRFEKCEPGQYIYQIDFGDSFFGVSEDYREFMRDTGVEIVQTWGFWIILRKLASEGNFELYTDVDSSIEHYNKIRKMFKVVAVIELLCFFLELFIGVEENNIVSVAPFLFIIGAIVVSIVNETFKINRIIAELQERQGIQPGNYYRGGKVSVLLPCGLLLNGCALVLQESIAPDIKMVLQIAAIALMLVGMYRTGILQKD